MHLIPTKITKAMILLHVKITFFPLKIYRNSIVIISTLTSHAYSYFLAEFIFLLYHNI